jgi:hypothetical protein
LEIGDWGLEAGWRIGGWRLAEIWMLRRTLARDWRFEDSISRFPHAANEKIALDAEAEQASPERRSGEKRETGEDAGWDESLVDSTSPREEQERHREHSPVCLPREARREGVEGEEEERGSTPGADESFRGKSSGARTIAHTLPARGENARGSSRFP